MVRAAKRARWQIVTGEYDVPKGTALWLDTSEGGGYALFSEGLDPNVAPVSAPITVTDHTDAPPPEETAVDRLAEILIRGREQTESRVKVTELQDDGTRAWCADYTPDECEQGGTLNLIRRKWGPGRYLIELYARNPATKKFSCYGRDTVVVKHQAQADPADAVGAQLGLLAERLEQAIAPRASNPIEQLKETLGLMTMMRQAMGLGVEAPKPQSMASQLGELIQIMRGAKDIAKEVEPDPTPDNPLLALAPKALDVIQTALAQQGRGAGLTPVALPPSLAAPAPSPIPSDAGTPDNLQSASALNGEPMDPKEREFREALAAVNTMAKMGIDHDEAAELIFNQLPLEAEELLKRPDWFEGLCRIHSGCRQHVQWYEQVRTHLLKFFAEPLDGGDSSDLPAAA
jgi:hypothetical protein